MIRLKKISFLLFAVALFSGITETANSVVSCHDVEFNHDENQQETSAFSEKTAEFFGSYPQVRAVIDLTRILPVPNAKDTETGKTNPGQFSEFPIRHSVSIYLSSSRALDLSLTVKELLFPFHHFL